MKALRIQPSVPLVFGCLVGASIALFFLHAARAVTSNFIVHIIPGPECYDGLDNDDDGLTDYPDDTDCASASDNSEGEPVVAGPPPSGVSGGGFSGFTILPTTSVVFYGFAYPYSRVVLLKDAQVAAETLAADDASFQLSLSDLNAGDHLFALYGESADGNRSVLNPFQISLAKGAITQVGVVVTPTLGTGAVNIRSGDMLRVEGDAMPASDILAEVSSEHDHYFYSFAASADGLYAYDINTADYADGQYTLRVRETAPNGLTSGYSRTRVFWVGDVLIPSSIPGAGGSADLDGDGAVNLVDFSIAAYWYHRPLSDDMRRMEAAYLNGDGNIDLADFSIIAYYWTG